MNSLTNMIAGFAGIVVFGWLGAAAQAQDLAPYDPIGDVADQMKVAVSHLGKLNTGVPTKTAQQEALRKLDVLIVELEKQSQNGKGRSTANPQKPANYGIKAGPGGSGALHAARPDGKQWGELPPHERDRILQSLTEGFPPHYQAILERYYKRLAEEKSSGSEEANLTKDGATKEPASQTPAASSGEKSE